MSEQTSKNNGKKASGLRKRLRHSSYAVIVTILVIGITVLVNLSVKAVEDNWALRLDMSYNSLTTFSDTTKQAIAGLEQDVVFYLMATSGSENAELVEILERYRAASKHIRLEVIDPDKNPGLVNQFRDEDTTLGNNTVVVANADGTRHKVIAYYDMVNISMDQNTQQRYIHSYNFERMLTQGMLYAVADRTPTAYIMQGHGEPAESNLPGLVTLLRDNNYDVALLGLGEDMPDPDGNVLVVIAPSKDLDEQGREKVMAFLGNGGSMLYAGDIGTPNDLTNFNAILHYYGVGLEEGMVVGNPDDYSQFYYLPSNVLAVLGEHEITSALRKAAGRSYVISAQSRAVAMPEMDRSDFVVTPLLSSAEGSYLADAEALRASWARMEGEPFGPFHTAVSIEHHVLADQSRNSRVVLLGSALTITSPDLLNSFYNGEFVLSAFRWLSRDAAVKLNIVSKTASRGALQITSQSQLYTLAAIAIAALPLLIFIVGIIVCTRRRHL